MKEFITGLIVGITATIGFIYVHAIAEEELELVKYCPFIRIKYGKDGYKEFLGRW